MSFLLLRPQAKCHSSVTAFKAAGLDAVACGLIDTQLDPQALATLPQKIASLSANTLVIVTSTVAAQQCVKLAELWPGNQAFFAVGQSTADILQQANFATTVPADARSEGLLALSQLQQVSGKHLVIIKGFGGRELLADTLTARGAQVSEWELYQRVNVANPLSTHQWHEEQIQCIIATSGEVIEAAFNAFSAAWLKTKLWIVVSPRTADIAKQHGVSQINISENASDQALINSAKLMSAAN
ncbi:uroporphyrinogen-III synthase [Paraglaciecola hydrolytica]|uniref:Uroporphyrinogen-III synthase n=1 Tax=Paraglaciecola hydrolytica TaxID=1799789 RepID=A0A148KKJ4_9ALTE|nr:uroporphyrinogen-III synthase [Paraglaciecola hydrolytica]KXI26800.1 uroporphyrinogen-III synthase [Paraglaciecola hydrolytica]